MREIDVRAAVQDFSHLVADVQATGKVVTITKDGVPAAVLLSADEFESMQETIFWLSQPGIREDIEQAEQEARAGRTFGEDEIRTKFGVPKRSG
ncbi:type II toxin-antitoxin system Phd/YefM family antitoxin [Mycobacterium intracellulare]|uniref:Antitoxin n=1 Tax=Mycobacterium intracellulare subsp. chimaera TaxID=222805 RepID=A0A220YCB0_MYCIT|nr:type II toxin-antitoxin system Phd/YefM family antitoxin [Mycobacterium intracellulare]ASL09530.1 antitoxin [Mycobacterium intracellulare subsp. chimaera]ASL15219.1 antitoxin [Mycobacterium intracellulare subsp. chimaera]ASL21333.1 antitoxin [Mycobacterium intracellulare subsp. chimaera]ASQ86434.1 prevent-host-death family protein [Mycobacterium intracellulare subsp. chimaera]MCA2312624.1 type II toxin-antitoxin system prevent-host-death family antitoxin [Mycobacterium intracellulare subsp.